MNIEFLGGASEVGSLAMKMEIDQVPVVFDFGFTPSKPPKFPSFPEEAKFGFLTHAHIDHSGMMPWLCGHLGTTVVGTPLTMDISNLLCEDSLKIARYEAYPFPYDSGDVFRYRKCFDEHHFGDRVPVGDQGATVQLRSAGHIPGASMYLIEADRTYLFTGDINTIETKLVMPVKPVKCDILIMESTYASREHPDRKGIEKEFIDKVDDVVHRGGLAVIPSFAVGRTQEILLLLQKCGHEVWLDGMGRTVNEIMLDHGRYVKNAGSLKRATRRVKEVYSSHGRSLAKKGEVIVTTSGMLDGGPVMDYMVYIKDDPKSALLLTGYQVDGTNGRLLMDQGKIDFYGVKERMNCEVSFFDLSAHAGHSQLLEFVRMCEPKKVVLCHGDNRESLANDLKDEREVFLPENKEIFEV